VQTRVMAHPSRAAAAHRLADQLADLEPVVVLDPDPAGPPSAMRTLLRVCATLDASEPTLLLQDDAVPCDGFVDAAPAAFRALDERAVVAFYVGPIYRAIPDLRRCAARGATLGYLGNREYVPLVAAALPAGLLYGFASWARRNLHADFRHDDEAVGAYCRNHGVDVWSTVPCLVDHDNTHESIVGHNHGARNAWALHAGDASTVRWRR
jgi:hypothetical protein